MVDHSDAEVLVVENLARFQKQVRDIRSALKKVKLIVLMSNERSTDAGIVGFVEFMVMGHGTSDCSFVNRHLAVDANICATKLNLIISGMTGNRG